MRDAIERLECPEDFAQQLADVGGYNHFGEPLFRMMWAQSEVVTVAGVDGKYTEEFTSKDPVWMLQKWMPPEAFGTPGLYYAMMRDEATGACLTGEYPDLGRYVTIIKFKTTRFDSSENRVVIETIPLDFGTLEMFMPILLKLMAMTEWEIEAAKQAEREIAEQAVIEEMADRMYDALPEFYGPVSYAGQGNRTALIDREMAKIEQQWRQLSPEIRRRMPQGFFQKN